MTQQIQPLNLSHSFLSKVISKGYDYAVGEKLGLISKDTANMSAGRIVHAIIAHKFGHEAPKIAISPFKDFRTNASKEWRDSQPDDTAILKEHEYKAYEEIAERVVNHPVTKKLTAEGEITAEIKSEKAINGFNVKGIIDLRVKSEATTVIDWKFLSTTSFDKFTKQALWDNYDLQAAVYDFLEDATHVYFGVIESEAPFRIKYFFVTPSFLESGADKFNRAFQILKKENWRQPTFDIQEVTELVDWNNYNG